MNNQVLEGLSKEEKTKGHILFVPSMCEKCININGGLCATHYKNKH